MTAIVAYLISVGFKIRCIYSNQYDESAINMIHENGNELNITDDRVDGWIGRHFYKSNWDDSWEMILEQIKNRLE